MRKHHIPIHNIEDKVRKISGPRPNRSGDGKPRAKQNSFVATISNMVMIGLKSINPDF